MIRQHRKAIFKITTIANKYIATYFFYCLMPGSYVVLYFKKPHNIFWFLINLKCCLDIHRNIYSNEFMILFYFGNWSQCARDMLNKFRYYCFNFNISVSDGHDLALS